MEFWHNALLLLSRIGISALYLWAGWRKIRNWTTTQQSMKGKHTPYVRILLPIAIALQIVGGLSVLCGIYTRLGALLLILFTVPATIQMHDFWNLSGKERVHETAHFLKDCAILGGLLLLILMGSGSFSIH